MVLPSNGIEFGRTTLEERWSCVEESECCTITTWSTTAVLVQLPKCYDYSLCRWWCEILICAYHDLAPQPCQIPRCFSQRWHRWCWPDQFIETCHGGEEEDRLVATLFITRLWNSYHRMVLFNLDNSLRGDRRSEQVWDTYWNTHTHTHKNPLFPWLIHVYKQKWVCRCCQIWKLGRPRSCYSYRYFVDVLLLLVCVPINHSCGFVKEIRVGRIEPEKQKQNCTCGCRGAEDFCRKPQGRSGRPCYD